MRVRAILNPRAGLAARRALGAVERGSPAWTELEVKVTERAGHGLELAREAAAAGCDLALAVGGDGTANEVAEGLLGSETTLGLVPVGSGNGLARTLGIPLDPTGAVERLGGAVTRRMDVGFANGRLFLNVAGAGFDAAVGAAFHRRGKEGGRRGIFTYVKLGLANLSYAAETWTVEGGGQRFEGRALVVAMANGRQYGGGAVIAPRARLDDGQLEVVVIEDAPRLEVLLNAPRLFLGTIDRYRRYRRFEAAELTLTGPRSFDYHRDGEPEIGEGGVEVKLQARALKILVPKPVAQDPGGPFLPA